jgi:hypothetical protein
MQGHGDEVIAHEKEYLTSINTYPRCALASHLAEVGTSDIRTATV